MRLRVRPVPGYELRGVRLLRLRIKTLYNRDGTLAEHQYDDQTRQFCARHAERGDSDMEDQDANYEVLSGPGPLGARQEPSDVSESVDLGAVYLTDVDEIGGRA